MSDQPSGTSPRLMLEEKAIRSPDEPRTFCGQLQRAENLQVSELKPVPR